MMVLKDPGLWDFVLLCTLFTGVDESLIRAVLSHAQYLCDDDSGWEAADAQESENAEVLRSLLSDIYFPTDCGRYDHAVRCQSGSRLVGAR